MAEWLRAWYTLATMKLWRREVVSSIPDRGAIVGWVFSPTRQLVRFSHLNMPFFQNSEFIWNIVPVGSSNCRPSAPFLYEVASHVKNCHFGVIIILLLLVTTRNSDAIYPTSRYPINNSRSGSYDRTTDRTYAYFSAPTFQLCEKYTPVDRCANM